MFVNLFVNPSAAVRACKSRSGNVRVELTEEILSSLTEEQRQELAGSDAIDREHRMLNESNRPEIAEATPETLRQVLDWLIAEKKRKAAEKEAEQQKIQERTEAVLRERRTKTVSTRSDYKVWYDRIVPDWPYVYCSEVVDSPEAVAWKAELEQINQATFERAKAENERKEAEKAAQKQAEAEALARFQEARAAQVRLSGDENQIGRLEAGLLSVEEQDQIVREHLFLSLQGIPRYERLRAGDVPHADGCYQDESVSYKVYPAESLDADQWEQFSEIKVAAEQIEGAVVFPRRHTATCDECEAETDRYSALVQVDWHGHSYSREYAL